MGGTHAHIRTICSVAGPSCIVAFILLSLASRAFFADFDAAFATQLPLTISGDTGCLVAIVIAYAYRNRIKHETAGYLFTLSAAGLCISGLAKIGVLRLDSPISLVSGDALSAFFATTCMLLWWHIVLKEHANTIERHTAAVGFISPVIYIAIGLLPHPASGAFAAIVLPLASCVSFAPFLAYGEHKTKAANETATSSETSTRIPATVALITVLSCIVVSLLTSLFPTSLFYDGPAVGSICLPGAFCAFLCMALAGISLAVTKRHALPLGVLYFTGFFLTVVGYLLSPYRPLNGAPLGAAEAGRLIICIFILFVALKVGGKTPSERMSASLKIALMACCTVVACDIAVVALQLTPNFDYSDFVFRTTFSAVGIAALAVLLLGPLPRFEVAFAMKTDVDNSQRNSEAPFESPQNISSRRNALIAQFAKMHGLTARETEVLSFIVAGRDVPYIERELVLAKSTVKTHVKHIYAKCGVSSKQDLIDLVQAFEK